MMTKSIHDSHWKGRFIEFKFIRALISSIYNYLLNAAQFNTISHILSTIKIMRK